MSCTAGTITVAAGFDPGAVQVTNCSLSSTDVDVGGTFEVSADVRNDNSVAAELDVVFDAGGLGVDSLDFETVGAGETVTFTAAFSADDAGTYDVVVDVENVAEA